MKTLNQITDDDYSSVCIDMPPTKLVSTALHGTTLHTVLSHPLSKEQVATFYSRLYRILTDTTFCTVKSGENYFLVHSNGKPRQRTEFQVTPGVTILIPFLEQHQYDLVLIRGRQEVIYPLTLDFGSRVA